jgi:TetR/AcrR family transcriptional repressor of nem operon
MKLTKEQAADNRQTIIETAGRLFREHGFDGVGVADLMKAAGFTHGGFYNHFSSKAALAAEAASLGMKDSQSKLTDVLMKEQRPGNSGLAKHVEYYLSPEHRDDRAGDERLRSLNDMRDLIELGPVECDGAQGAMTLVYFRDPDQTSSRSAGTRPTDATSGRSMTSAGSFFEQISAYAASCLTRSLRGTVRSCQLEPWSKVMARVSVRCFEAIRGIRDTRITVDCVRAAARMTGAI